MFNFLSIIFFIFIKHELIDSEVEFIKYISFVFLRGDIFLFLSLLSRFLMLFNTSLNDIFLFSNLSSLYLLKALFFKLAVINSFISASFTTTEPLSDDNFLFCKSFIFNLSIFFLNICN